VPANTVRTVQEVFREFVLSIPDYQRGYAWEKKQIEDFLEDLDLLSEGKAHYTGTLILHPTQGDGAEIEDASGTLFRRADVVDGQQRLTTIVILLAAIARGLSKAGQETLANGLRTTFVASVTPTDQPLLKLHLNHDSRSFWERNILADEPGPDAPSIVSHRRLLAARQLFDDYLAVRAGSLDAEEYLAWLNRLREKVVKQLRLTVYEVDDSSEVGVIFETQNDRGRPLTDLEKTKNLLLYLAAKLDVPEHGLAELVNETWTKLLQALSARDLSRSTDENALLRCHWLIFHNPRPRDWHGFESVKGALSLRLYKADQPALAKVIRRYLQTLGDCVGPFCDVMVPGHSAAFASWSGEPKLRNEVVDFSDKLRRIGAVANLVPLLVACRLRADFGPKQYVSILKAAERYAFRSRVTRSRADAGQGTLFPLAYRVQRGEATADDVLSGLLSVTNAYGAAKLLRFILASTDDWYAWPLLKYLLYEYELHRAGPTHPVQMSWERVDGRTPEQSIEHILPQTPTEPYWQERFDSAALKKWTNDLGNVCLTYDNSSYRNRSFPDKKGSYSQERMCYAKSPLYQEKDLCEFTDWTPETIGQRRESLLSFIWTRWEIEAVDPSELNPSAVVMPADAEEVDSTAAEMTAVDELAVAEEAPSF
jgi:hypothetical protein